MIPDTYTEIVFGNRKVRVTIWFGVGLGVVDPDRQHGITDTQVRTWIAYENREAVLHYADPAPAQPARYRQIGLALRGYAAFLDPLLERPKALDVLPRRYFGNKRETPPAEEIGAGSWIEESNGQHLYGDYADDVPDTELRDYIPFRSTFEDASRAAKSFSLKHRCNVRVVRREPPVSHYWIILASDMQTFRYALQYEIDSGWDPRDDEEVD